MRHADQSLQTVNLLLLSSKLFLLCLNKLSQLLNGALQLGDLHLLFVDGVQLAYSYSSTFLPRNVFCIL